MSPHPAAHSEIPLLIDTQADLDAFNEQLARTDQIAVDTEFVRTNTYKPQIGLVQIAVNGQSFCIDPLAKLDLAVFWRQLFDPQRQSIIHSGSQDMEVFWFTCNQLLTNLIDTQVCAALLGYPAQVGYAGLAAELVGADIAKSQTRTDWSRRPLTDAQIDYAAEDVEHLERMHELLRARLDELGRYDWAVEDSLAMARPELYEPDPDAAWQRLKSIPFLPADQQARARQLAAWREVRACQLDKPRSWILSDKALLQLAERNPTDRRGLQNIEDLPPAVARKQGDALLQILSDATAAVQRGNVDYVQEVPNPEKDRAQVKKLGRIIRDKAQELSIVPEVLGSKRDIQALIKDSPDARLTRGWRKALVGDTLREALAG